MFFVVIFFKSYRESLKLVNKGKNNNNFVISELNMFQIT